MNWDEFCLNNNIGSKSKNVDFKSLDPYILEIGKRWLKKPFSMVLFGEAGRGKTYFTLCLAKAIVDSGKIDQLYFKRSKHLDDDIIWEFEKYKTAAHCINAFSRIPILMIDDFGIDRNTERVERDFYEIIDNRWSHEMTTVISTNLNRDQIEKVYGSRIFSRMKDFYWVGFSGPDLRGMK